MSKEEKQKIAILNLLIKKSPMTAQEIAHMTDLSEKTVRGKIELLDNDLRERKIGFIKKEPGIGISLFIKNEEKHKLISDCKEVQSIVDQPNSIRKKALFLILKYGKNDYITQGWLSKKLYISIPTLRSELSSLIKWLEEYQLSLTIVRKKGMKVLGREYYYRLAVTEYILKYSNKNVSKLLSDFCPGLDVEKIKDLIKIAERNWKIEFSRNSFNRIWIMICLSICRKDKLSENDFDQDHQLKVEYYSEYHFSESVYKLLELHGYAFHSVYDVEWLSMIIIGANKLSWLKDSETSVDGEASKLEEFVEKVISSISDVLEVDLTQDDVLRYDLQSHLRSALFRMKFGQRTNNTLSQQLKMEYPDVFLSSWSTSQLFETYYNIQVTENELSYIVLYIQAALLRKEKKVEAILISNQGKSQALFVAELIKKNVTAISNIKIVRQNELLKKDYEDKIILSDSDLNDKNVIRVSLIPTSDDFAKISHVIESGEYQKKEIFHFSRFVQPLFDPELFFQNIEVEGKKELLTLMSKKMEQMGFVTPEFFATLWNREKKTTTCVGNMVAIPHGSMDEVNEPKISVANLKNPIEWYEGEKVSTVFLIAAKMNSDINIERTKRFYSDLISLVENKSFLEKFRKIDSTISSFQCLFNY